MSARGARSRKAVVKDIEKKEKKAAQKGKAPDSLQSPNDAFAEWKSSPAGTRSNTSHGPPTRQLTVSTSRRSISTNGSNSRPTLRGVPSHTSFDHHLSNRRPESVSDTSSTGKDKSKYQVNGKETKAPRGRRGGVPTKKSELPTPLSPLLRTESSLNWPSHPHNKSWMNFRIWKGGEDSMKPYGGFDFDEDLQQGSVLIYFTEEQMNEERPLPQIRAELDVLESSGSTWLSNALIYGALDDNDDWTLAGSPESSVTRQSISPNFPVPPGQRQMLGPVSPNGISPPPFNINQAYYGVPGYASDSRTQHYPDIEHSGTMSPPPSFYASQDQPATHELWFTAPAHLKTQQKQRLHHVAIRNFIAMLHNKPIVGADMYEMLTTLQAEIQVMYDLDHHERSRLTPRERSVQMITNYLTEHKLDDVRNSIKLAINLLAWAEQDNVRWRQGYLESFVHLAGILNPQIEALSEFQRLSIATRRNLSIAAKTLQLRVIEAEEKLVTFDFDDIWPDRAKAAGSPVYQSYQAFRQFLVHYLTRTYGNWPPSQNEAWLNRKIVLDLQRDFGNLYDYLVDRDVVWDAREERPGNKWRMVNLKLENFRANLPELSLSDMLVSWDNKHGYLHIPHAYPLLPRDVPQTRVTQKKSLFSSLKKNKPDTTKDAKMNLQLSIVFSDATNMEKLDSSFSSNALIDKFEHFELGADLKTTTPREARLGRWVLLHGILQVLSTLSVDVQALKHTDGVRYFLCTDLKRCPDWVTNGQIELLEACQQRSWCWQRSWDPTPTSEAPSELEANVVNVPSEDLQSNTLDGATLMDDEIRRIGEKIDKMSVSRITSHSTAQRKFEERRKNATLMQGDFATHKIDNSYKLTESDYITRPLVPNRSPLRSPGGTPLSPRPSPKEPNRDHLPSTNDYFLTPEDFPTRGSSMPRDKSVQHDDDPPGRFD